MKVDKYGDWLSRSIKDYRSFINFCDVSDYAIKQIMLLA